MPNSDLPIDEEYVDFLFVNFEDSLDLEEINKESMHLVGLLIADQKPS